MERHQLQGRAPTLRDQQRSFRSRISAHETPALPASGGEFFGPPTPRHVLISRLPQDWETTRYWQLVAEIQRYGYCEFSAKGTPFVGDAFGL